MLRLKLALITSVMIVSCDRAQFVVDSNKIIDKYGRESYFHGLNVIYKSPPYIPMMTHFDSNLSFCEEDMQLLSSLGMNIIRLGVMWPGVAPLYNYYNETYIDKLKQLISVAYEKYNIHTLVDCHQDSISQSFCGEGAPFWAVNLSTSNDEWNFPMPIINESWNTSSNEHIPSKEDCSTYPFTKYYHSYDVSNIFDRLYSNYDNLCNLFGEYWGVVANNFKNISGIVGFELLNEPWPGNMYENDLLHIASYVNQHILQPFYEKLFTFIHKYDDKRIIFYEPVTYHESHFVVDDIGFTSNPGGDTYNNQSVLAIHYYTFTDEYIANYVNYSNKVLNTTTFITEFSIGNDMQSKEVYDITAGTMAMADKYLISWIGWEYKYFACSLPDGTCTGPTYGLFQQNGTINTMVAKVLSRTYAQKVAGKTISMYFDNDNGYFELQYNLNTDIVDPTVIYTNSKYWYVNGYNLTIEPNNDSIIIYNVTGDYVNIYNTNNNQYDKHLVHVKIEPL